MSADERAQAQADLARLLPAILQVAPVVEGRDRRWYVSLDALHTTARLRVEGGDSLLRLPTKAWVEALEAHGLVQTRMRTPDGRFRLWRLPARDEVVGPGYLGTTSTVAMGDVPAHVSTPSAGDG